MIVILTRNRRTAGPVGVGDEGSALASLSSAGEGESTVDDPASSAYIQI